LIEDFRIADIPSMNDVLRAAQRLDGFRPKQAMRVGDDADLQRQFSDFRFQNNGKMGFLTSFC
jgi:hypothetical protein